MNKTAIKNASNLLEEVPARDEDALEDYIARNKRAQSDLKAYLNGPRSLSAFEYSEGGTLMEQLQGRVPYVENTLEAVRSEIAQDIDSGYEEEFDLPTTVNRLAAQKAMETHGYSQLDKFYSAKRAFQENIEPILVEGYEDFPRQKYLEAFDRYAAMNADQLRRVVAEEFPKDEWIGEEPEEAEDLNPTGVDEGAPEPEGSFLDQEFGQGEWRNTLKNRQSKKADGVPEGLKPYVGDDDDDDSDEEDENKNASKTAEWSPEELARIILDETLSNEEKLEEIRALGDSADADYDEDDIDFGDEEYQGTREEFSNTVTNDAGEMRWASLMKDMSWNEIYNLALKTSGFREFKFAVEQKGVDNNQGADMVGDGFNEPESDDAMENWFDSESNKGFTGHGPGSKSSQAKLAAAMKLANTYDIEADDALELVEKVLEDE